LRRKSGRATGADSYASADVGEGSEAVAKNAWSKAKRNYARRLGRNERASVTPISPNEHQLESCREEPAREPMANSALPARANWRRFGFRPIVPSDANRSRPAETMHPLNVDLTLFDPAPQKFFPKRKLQ